MDQAKGIYQKELGMIKVLTRVFFFSFLAAVIIIFIQDVIDTVNDKREPENTIQFKMLISSMTVREKKRRILHRIYHLYLYY
jgi:hypothetical protein